MTESGEAVNCRRCGAAVGVEGADALGWCSRCRGEVVKRSTTWSVLPALLVGLLYAWLLSYFGMLHSSFVIVWLALGVGLAWVSFKIARRVWFEVFRSRAARPRAS
jgi:membrane-associated phospholipid phosphatase